MLNVWSKNGYSSTLERKTRVQTGCRADCGDAEDTPRASSGPSWLGSAGLSLIGMETNPIMAVIYLRKHRSAQRC